MSGELEARAEIVKLARLLEVDPDALSYLGRVSTADLARLRDQVTEALYARATVGLKRMAAASNRIPGAISAPIAQRVLGPVLCARLAGMLDPSKAIDIAKRLPPDFLADVAIHIDPRRANQVIGRLPCWLVAQIAGKLGRRREYVAMGRFVGHLGDDALRASAAEIDDESLLRIAFVMEGKDRLDHVMGLLPDERLGLLINAADDAGLWPEALDLLEHLGPDGVADRLLGASLEERLPRLIAAVDEGGLWKTGLQLLAGLDSELKEKLAAPASTLDADERGRVAEQARSLGLFDELGPIGEALATPR